MWKNFFKIVVGVLLLISISGFGICCIHINQIVSESEEIALNAEYESALSVLEKGYEKYPFSKKLQEKINEYEQIYFESVKENILEDADALAEQADYESAMSMLWAARELYGYDEEYENAYKMYEKKHALTNAQLYSDNGDYVSAIDLLVDARENNAEDLELLTAYRLYCEKYVDQIIMETEGMIDQRKYSEAIEIVTEGLNVLPENEELENKLSVLESQKPISITSLTELNSSYWYWNEYEAKDPFGNDYSQTANYFVHRNANREAYIEYRVYQNYDLITGTISPHADIGENYTGIVQIYVDDVLVDRIIIN